MTKAILLAMIVEIILISNLDGSSQYAGYIVKWAPHNNTMFLKQRNIVFECNIFTV